MAIGNAHRGETPIKGHQTIRGVPESRLPVPTGYKILVVLPEIEETTAGGIILTEATLQTESVGACVAQVLRLGPTAYMDERRFPKGPYCKEGDFIIMQPYSGSRFKVDGVEFRLINDDSVEAVVSDPRGVQRA